MSSKQFTARTFKFLYQINENHKLLAVDLKIALTLTLHFNEKEGGRAYPSCEHPRGGSRCRYCDRCPFGPPARRRGPFAGRGGPAGARSKA